MVQRERCPNCNGELESIGGGQFRCKACRTVFDETTTTDEEKLLLTAAAKLLRDGEFDTADSSYRDIISSHPKNYEAYFGRALCKHGIIFVNDITENKMVPTCYITDVGSFLDDSNYKRAVEFAPDIVKEQYIEQGNKIENIINEWKEKASKQHYDIFISFKDSENGKRTEDSVEAQNLYTHLIQLGYKVFFSRETLRELVSERYEPYIFNAINVAPIMIVYGQKGEYLESTWVRNEWSRFIKKIQSGEKDKAGLIVCYENMDASELPFEFKAIQCMDASRKEFYGDLEAHIKKVLDKVRKPNSEIDTIQTEYGKVGKKAAKLNYSEVKMNVLGTTQIEKVTETDEFILNTARKYFERGLYEDCNVKLNAFLERNEYNYEANLLKTLISREAKDLNDYISKILFKGEAERVKFLTTLVSKEEALKIIELLYARTKECLQKDDCLWMDLFFVLYDLDFPENKELRYSAIEHIISHDDERCDENFDEFIKYIDNADIDFHIKVRLEMIKKSLGKNFSDVTISKYIQEIQEIDEGNIENLRYKLFNDLGVINKKESINAAINNPTVFFDDLEEILKFSSEREGAKEISSYIDKIITLLEEERKKETKAKLIALFDKLIRYFQSKNNKDIADALWKMCRCLYKLNYFDGCIEYANTLLTYCDKKEKGDVIYLMLLCRARIPDYGKDGAVRYATQKVNTYDEWNTLLAMEDERIESDLFYLYDLQEEEANNREIDKEIRDNCLEQLNEKKTGLIAQKRKIQSKRNWYFAIATTITLVIVIGAMAALAYAFYLFDIRHEKGMRILINILYPFVLFAFYTTFVTIETKGKDPKNKSKIKVKETTGQKVASVVNGVTLVASILALLFQFIYGIFLKRVFTLPKNALSNMCLGSAMVLLFTVMFLVLGYEKISAKYDVMKNKNGKEVELEVFNLSDRVRNINEYDADSVRGIKRFEELNAEFEEIYALKQKYFEKEENKNE